MHRQRRAGPASQPERPRELAGSQSARHRLPRSRRSQWPSSGGAHLRGADESADEYKYLLQRLALFLERLYRGTQWVVFEPNDEPWAQVRLNVGAFMVGLFRQGVPGVTAKDTYLVMRELTTTNHQSGT